MLRKVDIILIRHGKTVYNVSKKFMGSGIDAGLSEEGAKEVKEKREGIRAAVGDAVVYTGPLLRARQTAELIFYDKTVNVEESLTEINFGDFEGKSAKDLEGDVRFQRWIDSDGTLVFPNGEGMYDFRQRTMRSLHKIINAAATDDRIATVCHGGNIMSIMSSIAGGAYYDYLIPNLDGYVIKATVEDDNITDVSYKKLSDS